MQQFTKKYQIWVHNGDSGYTPYEYDTLKECLLHERYGTNFYITQNVDFKVTNLS